MELNRISEFEYKQMLARKLYSKLDMLRLASYPYVSLLSLYENLSNNECRKIREIEDDNISTFLHIASLLFGIGSQDEINTINRNLNVEPLRSAVIAARQETDPAKRMPTYIELACKIMLSMDENKPHYMMNAIDIRIYGKIPALPFSNRQRIADEWFNKFVDLKLEGMKKVFLDLGAESAYKFVLSSTLYSLYHFAPSRYYIANCHSDDEALHKVLEVFTKLKTSKL